MSKILALQIALVSLVVAQETVSDSNFDGWWYHLPRDHAAAAPPFESLCLLRTHPVPRRDDYNYTPGIGGHKVHTRALTWAEARRACEEEGAHLAIINSIAESNVITELWKNAEAVFKGTGDTEFASIGFHDLFEEGEYMTIHGETLAKAGFTQWANRQPDNANGVENCGSVHKDGRLNDIPCTKSYAYICELPEA